LSYPYLTDVLRDVGIDIPLPVPTFGLMVGVAFFVSLAVARREVRRKMPEQAPDFMDNVGYIGFFAGLVGARLFHALEYPAEFLANPVQMIFSRGGFSIFGGLVFSIVAATLYARWKRAPLAPLLDAGAPGLMLGYAIGRIGCQISGDGDWGIAADLAAKPDWLPTWLWAQEYVNNIAGVDIPPPGVYPTPLYETVMAAIAFGVLWRLRFHAHRAGWLFCVYLLLTGVERMLIESIRVNAKYNLFGMDVTQAQLISAGCIVAGLVGIAMFWRRPAG
jgi:phosphatidylglycerol:prolipoprotein diacylglycerol transferase